MQTSLVDVSRALNSSICFVSISDHYAVLGSRNQRYYPEAHYLL
jgi:hypothetical protein